MRNIAIVMVVLLALGVSATSFAAPSDEGEGRELVDQGEMAQMLVRTLGLYRFLPPNPTNADCFEVLMVNRISPLNGWESRAPVTREDLARVVILSMGEEGNVENPDDPQSWVDALQGMGVDVESVGQVQSVRQVATESDFISFGSGSVEGRSMNERELPSEEGSLASLPLTSDEIKYVLRGLDPNDYLPSAATPN